MGADYKAYAVLGVKLERREIFKPKRIKAFEHNHPEDWKVDPKTGRELWTSYDVCILNDSEELYGKLSVGIEVCSDTDNQNYYLGKVVSQDDYRDKDNFISIVPPSAWGVELFNSLRNILKPHNLWFPERFGVYAVQYCSY
jgi:hypothetical protein